MVEPGVLVDEMLEVVDDEAVLYAFRVVGGDRRELGGGEEASDAAAVAGGGGGIGGAGVGLAARASGFVEEGAVDFGGEEVGGLAEIEDGGGAEGEGLELRLGECGHVDVTYGVEVYYAWWVCHCWWCGCRHCRHFGGGGGDDRVVRVLRLLRECPPTVYRDYLEKESYGG